MSATRARSGPRTLLAIAAALGLVAALALPALASHEDDLELVEPSAQSEECAGFDFGFKLDNIDQLQAGVYTASDENHTVFIEIELFESGNEVTSYTILDADPEIDDVFVKQPIEGGGISHLTFCYNEDEETPTPSPTPTPTPTPSPTEETASPTPSPTPTEGAGEGEETPTPTPTTRDDVAGGNPTPTPGGGTVPDTAMGGMTQVPATVLSLIMLAALAATAYARLARQR